MRVRNLCRWTCKQKQQQSGKLIKRIFKKKKWLQLFSPTRETFIGWFYADTTCVRATARAKISSIDKSVRRKVEKIHDIWVPRGYKFTLHAHENDNNRLILSWENFTNYFHAKRGTNWMRAPFVRRAHNRYYCHIARATRKTFDCLERNVCIHCKPSKDVCRRYVLFTLSTPILKPIKQAFDTKSNN